MTAMSAEASDMSSYLLMGVPGVALAGLVGMNGRLHYESQKSIHSQSSPVQVQ